MGVRRFSRLVALGLLAVASAALLRAQEKPTLHGRWRGSIQTPGTGLPIELDLIQGKDEQWLGSITIPSQGLNLVRLSDLSIAIPDATFSIPGIPGNPTFKGRLSDDGKTLSGDFSQGGGTFPFSVERTSGQPRAPREPKPFEVVGVPGEGLEGIWLGALEAGPARLRLLFKISKAADGNLTGTLDSLDQNASGARLTKVQLEGEVVLIELQHPPAEFRGAMSSDGSQITGDWRQTGNFLPLVIYRQEKSPDENQG